MEEKKFIGLDGLKYFWTKIEAKVIKIIEDEIAQIIANAPEDLDTLKEIADWISTHEDSASAMNTAILANTEAISGKADKSHTHTKSQITDFPTSLKNPNALTINGKTYDGSTAVYAGVQTVANGGTGVTTQADINKAFIYNLNVGNDDVTDGTEFVSSWASDNGFSDTNAINKPYKRKFSKVWNYIKGKISSALGLTATDYSGKASTAGTADKTVNDITIYIPYVTESGQYVIPLGNILEPTSTEINSPYNWDITGFFSIIRSAGHNGSHIQFEAGHGYSHDWTTYAYLDKLEFRGVTISMKAFQYNEKWWLGLYISTSNQGYGGKMTITYSRGLPATPTCILYYSVSNGVANKEINDSIQDIPSSWWRQRTICNPTSFSDTLYVNGVIIPRLGTDNGATVSIGRSDGKITIGDINNKNSGYTTINNDCKILKTLFVSGNGDMPSDFEGGCNFERDISVHSKSLFPSGYIPRTYYIQVTNLNTLTTENKALLKKLFAFMIFKRVSNINCTFDYRSTSTSVASYINANGYGYIDYEGVITIDDSDNIILDSDFNCNWWWLTGSNNDGDYICLDAFDAAYKILNNDWSFFSFVFIGSFTLLEKV